MNSLIMQLEIEIEDNTSEDLNKSYVKELKINNTLSLHDSKNKHLEAALQAYVLFTNHYPLDLQYTFEVTQPPELCA